MEQARSEAVRYAPVKKAMPHLREILLMVGAYFAYMYTRKLVYSDFEAQALENAQKIVELERSFGFFWEPTWQSWTVETAKSAVLFFNWAYIVTFGPAVIVIAIVVYVTNRERYWYYRNVILISFAVALVGYMLFPLAPPHMLALHFVDTIKEFGPTAYASGTTANYYNAYAAMPSLHFAWTVIIGVMLLRMRWKPLKVLGILYPVITLFAIIVTGKHFFLDAAGGAVVMIWSFALVELGVRRHFFVPKVKGYLQAALNR